MEEMKVMMAMQNGKVNETKKFIKPPFDHLILFMIISSSL